MAPQVFRDGKLFIDGYGYVGVVSSIKLPDIVQETVEAKGGIGAKYTTGAISAMEATFTLKVTDANLYIGFGLNTFKNKVPIVIKGSIFQDGSSKPVLVALTGNWESLNLAAMEAGKEIETEIKMQVHFYSLTIDGAPVILVDAQNYICMIGGVDYLKDFRDQVL
jgi:P2 family phage contractile tail tube protein